MDDFLLRALAGGLGVALIAGPLGCFIVWRRMAYFGATLAHAALLGIALGLLARLGTRIGIVIVCAAVAAALVALERRRGLAVDTVLGILAHGSLALGLVAVTFTGDLRVDLLGYLFGDVLALTPEDLLWIYGGGIACAVVLARIWRSLLAITVHEEIARVDGVPVERVRIVFLGLVSVVIAVAMQVVGLLLIVSLLIVPAAAARAFSRSPEQMATGAALIGAVSVTAGLGVSLAVDTPAGASIVSVAVGLFGVSLILPRLLGIGDHSP